MRIASLVLSCLVLASPAASLAQSTTAIRVGALRSNAHTPLALEREEVELDCPTAPTADGAMECVIRVRYTLSNPELEARSVALHFTVENISGFVVGDQGTEGTSDAPVLSSRQFPFGPEATRVIELSGEADLVRIAEGGAASRDAISARHPLLATSLRVEERGFIYSRAVTRHFVSAPEDYFVRARLPEGYALDASGEGASRVVEESVDGWSVVRVHRPEEDADLHFRVVVHRGGDLPVLRNGGPFIALGGVSLSPGPLPNLFWGRLGYEVGFLDWLIVSVSAESNFSDRFGLGVMIEAASPSFGIPPSFSVGAGAAIRILPEATAGVRLAAGLTVLSVGFEALFDYYPVDNGFTITLLGRAGL